MDLKIILRDVELFHGMSEKDLGEIATIFGERILQKGELVAKQGTPGDSLFVVTEGFVEVARETGGSSAPNVTSISDKARSLARCPS